MNDRKLPTHPSFGEQLRRQQEIAYGFQRTEAAKLNAEQDYRDGLRDYMKKNALAFAAPLSGTDDKTEEWFKAGVSPEDAIDRLRHGH